MNRIKKIGYILVGGSLLAAQLAGADQHQNPPQNAPSHVVAPQQHSAPSRAAPSSAPMSPQHRQDEGWARQSAATNRSSDKHTGGHPGTRPPYWHRDHMPPRKMPSRPYIVPWFGWCNWDCGLYGGYPGWFRAWCWDNPRFYSRFSTISAQDTFELPPPPGYESEVVSYFKAGDFRTIRVELEKEILLPDRTDGIELTVLRDDNADGTLEQAVSIAASTRELAIKEYVQHEEGNFRKELGLAQAMYDRSISGAGSMYRNIVDVIRAKGEW